MKTDLVTISAMVLERLSLICGIAERRTMQREAAKQLGLGLRQVDRENSSLAATNPTFLLCATTDISTSP
jgi:hypothetical protein